MSEIETSEIIWRNYNKFKTGESNSQNEIKTPFDTRNRDGAENQNKWTNLKILKQKMKEPHSRTETKTSLDPRHHKNGAENWNKWNLNRLRLCYTNHYTDSQTITQPHYTQTEGSHRKKVLL